VVLLIATKCRSAVINNEVYQIFNESGAVLYGHFLLTSGLHSDVYWEKMRVVQHPKTCEHLCKIIVKHYKDLEVDFVAGPTTAGIILAYEIAKKLNKPCLFAEKVGEERQFKRGLELSKGQKVLIIDDILTTGKSVNEVITAVEKAGAIVIAIAVLVDRSEKGLKFNNIPVFSCLRAPAVAYKPDDCPMCKQGVPLSILGSAKKI